jgi:hypothetical protein
MTTTMHGSRRRDGAAAIGMPAASPCVEPVSNAGANRPESSPPPSRPTAHRKRRLDVAAQLDARHINIFILKYY